MTTEELLHITYRYDSPCYVYDTLKIVDQFNKLKHAFKEVKNLKINYAVKALSNVNILKLMKSLGSGLDTVSLEEIQLGLLAGFNSKDIIFTPNGVSLNELEEAATLGVQINIDNLSLLEQFGTKYPHVPVCIRINPHIMAG